MNTKSRGGDSVPNAVKPRGGPQIKMKPTTRSNELPNTIPKIRTTISTAQRTRIPQAKKACRIILSSSGISMPVSDTDSYEAGIVLNGESMILGSWSTCRFQGRPAPFGEKAVAPVNALALRWEYPHQRYQTPLPLCVVSCLTTSSR